MLDEQSGSWWSHINGLALTGPFKGSELSTIPAIQTNWAGWSEKYPDTKVLRKSEEVRASSYADYFKDPDRLGIFRTGYLMDLMPGKVLVHGLAIGAHALAVSQVRLDSSGYIEADLDSTSLIIVKTSSGGVRAFERSGLSFNVPDPKTAGYRDKQSASIWDMDKGRCISGEFKDRQLKARHITTAYWFAWSSFYPNTAVID